jgi:hypothetical protein
MVAASSITALLNLAGDLEIPFVFGGDGVTVLIPPTLVENSKESLIATQILSKKDFDLDLRVAIIPIQDLYDLGHKIEIAKLRISDQFKQAILHGDGVDIAEMLLKDPAIIKYDLNPKDNQKPMADFAGLSCRWQDVPSRHGETISLIIKVLNDSDQKVEALYMQILTKIREFYGTDKDHRPINEETLNLTLNASNLLNESKTQNYGKSFFPKNFYLLTSGFINLFGILLEKVKMTFNGYDPKKHKQKIVLSTDYKKFDGSLKMIISGTEEQRVRLENYLNNLADQKKLVYGIHVSDRALITCLVMEKTDRAVHFVDAADGGYALAAKKLKSRLKNL